MEGRSDSPFAVNASASAPFEGTLRRLWRCPGPSDTDPTGGLSAMDSPLAIFHLAAPIFLPCPRYSWTQPLTPIWRSHRSFERDLRPCCSIFQTLNYLDYWTSVTFTALLCIALQLLMGYYTIYDDIRHASQPKLELLDWTGLYGGDLSQQIQCQVLNWKDLISICM